MKKVPPERIQAFNKLLGLDQMRAGDGQAELVVEVRPEITNRRGVVHGGLLTALLDSVLGAAVIAGIAPEEWCGTVQIDVQFLEPARGPQLTGRARLERRGRRVAMASGEVVDSDGRTVAKAQGTWYVWPSRPEGGVQQP